MERGIEECGERIRHVLNSSDTLTSDGDKFCSKMLSDSEKFANALILWISQFHDRLVKSAVFKPEAVWELSLEALSHIFQELVKARNRSCDGAAANPGLYYWGMLRAWEIQQRYLLHKFGDDPSLNGIFIRKVCFSQDEQAAQMSKDIVKLQSQVKSLMKPKSG